MGNTGEPITTGEASESRQNATQALQNSGQQPTSQEALLHFTRGPSKYPGIQLQPETRPITLNQLVNEVKGIYVGLVMVESKCIEIDSDQGNAQAKFSDEQWQALITLHRTLLHEHHDFMLASQHPSGSPALRRLAQKYAMPARMWRHGIHSFLELLRHRLPESQEHMVTFIYLAYSMVALLYETVPAFEDTWIECLGDLSRYRMAIEDDNQRIRDTWANVSREWYTLASRRAPTTGRLYHHRAILARQHVTTQLYYYAKSLCVPIPFLSTRESILTLLEPVLSGSAPRVAQIDLAFVLIHAILFTGKSNSQLAAAVSRFHSLLPRHIEATGRAWIETGAHTAIILCCAQLQYGADDNDLMKLLRLPPVGLGRADDGRRDTRTARTARADAREPLTRSQALALETSRIVLSLVGNVHCYGFVHVLMAWLVSLAQIPGAMDHVERTVDWPALVTFLNAMLKTHARYDRLLLETVMQVPEETEREEAAGPPADTVPHPPQQRSIEAKPLPEDWTLRGLLFGQLFPAGWFGDAANMDDNEVVMETSAMTPIRCERILWLGVRLAHCETWMLYDAVKHEFSVAPEFDRPAGEADEGADEDDDEEDQEDDVNNGKVEEDDDINLSDAESLSFSKGPSTSTLNR